MNVETLWNRFKRSTPLVNRTTNPMRIERLADFYSMRGLIEPNKFYEFTLRSINAYYFDMLARYKIFTDQWDVMIPRTESITHGLEILSTSHEHITKMRGRAVRQIGLIINRDIENLAYAYRRKDEPYDKNFLRMLGSVR